MKLLGDEEVDQDSEKHRYGGKLGDDADEWQVIAAFAETAQFAVFHPNTFCRTILKTRR